MLFLCIGTLFTSCVNEDMEEPAVGKGESTLSVDIAFRPLSDPLTTRTAGDAIKHINDLSIVIYKADGTLHSCTHYTSSTTTATGSNFTTSEVTPENYPVSDDPLRDGFAESKTCKTSTISIPNVPYGKYRMYAVVNMNRVLTEAETASEEALRAIQLTWNANDIASNNAMFGFFDTEANKATVGTSVPEITINAQAVSLHAWVKRAASKVTVAYDGSNLKENIYIYIHSAQIKDIPKTCYLGKENKPTAKDQLNSDGEKISYTNGATGTTVGLTVTKGNPKHGSDHSETADALFFFENMQGDAPTDKTGGFGKLQDETGDGLSVTNPNGSDPSDKDYKDGVPYGSYIEVKGYYVNKSAENASQGNITYRFMLGKDVVRDCNAERNNHYKLTLRFKNDANNPDWHIDYTPENPEISVASPLYISYIHGESVDIPVVIKGGTNATLKAEIVENNWAYSGHKYEGRFDNGGDGVLDEGLWNGFLTLAGNTTPATADLAGRKTDFELGRTKTYSPVKVEFGSNTYHYNVKAFTRAINLGNSFSGNNVYVDHERSSKIKFTATVNGKSVSKTIEIIQVRRLVNPAGVWRPYNDASSFHVVLMETENEKNAEFKPIDSDGPWTAEIIEGDWVRISKDGSSYSTDKITGSTGSNVDFHYKPSGTIASNQSRFGVIRILYHNNTCVHYIFVSQGLAPVAMGTSGTKWHMTNVHCNGVDEISPLHEGSMFRWNNVRAILATNNVKPGYGYGLSVSGKFDCKDKDGVVSERPWPYATDDDNNDGLNDEDEYYLAVSKSGNTFSVMNTNGSPATCANWTELQSLERYYGVMYGPNSRETKQVVSDAYSFLYDSDDKGMRGMFVWDQSRKAHLFFPISPTGNGHRKHYDDVAYTDVKYQIKCVLRYAQRHMEMPENHTSYGKSVNVPLYYDLYERPGAIYWYRTWSNEFSSNPSNYTYDQYAHDINYFTFGFDSYGSNPVYKHAKTRTVYSSDAAYIRCVEN